MPSTMQALRTRIYSSTLYILLTSLWVGFDPMEDDRRYGFQPPIFSKPPVAAAVYLYQHSLTSHPLPSNTMLRRPATTRTVHTGVSQYLA